MIRGAVKCFAELDCLWSREDEAELLFSAFQHERGLLPEENDPRLSLFPTTCCCLWFKIVEGVSGSGWI